MQLLNSFMAVATPIFTINIDGWFKTTYAPLVFTKVHTVAVGSNQTHD